MENKPFQRQRNREKKSLEAWASTQKRSYAAAWSWYVRGNIVSRHALRIIVQFMAACCGKSKTGDKQDEVEAMEEHMQTPLEPNTVPLARVHAILDHMSSQEVPRMAADKECDESETAKLLKQSSQIKSAVQVTASLWNRSLTHWPDTPIDRKGDRGTEQSGGAQPAAKQSSRHQDVSKKDVSQKSAYLNLNGVNAKTWLQDVYRRPKPPNREQKKLLEMVVDRCLQEAEELKQTGNSKELTEPERDCLFGIPGAGKSACIKWIIEFFTECLGWEPGVQFQCLASQNSMAALIGGATVHHWGGIPINAADAAEKVSSKGSGGDVDALYERCLGIRWLLLDEVSTLSPMLLGLLDSYLRRACKRHAYARRGNKSWRPFGGLNVLLCGDLWQLPPVKSIAIFGNPFKKELEFTEQRILQMFWKRGEDSIGQLLELKEAMRTKDTWLQEQLTQDRHGEESWEVYCFVHGLPTRNVGSWCPSTNAPTCGRPLCATLASHVWPELWRRRAVEGSWKLRVAYECETCAVERKRRCCVLQGGDDKRHQREPFAHAPFVHPFNAPKYHAQQLRAVNFAKATNRQVLWVIARDKVLTKSEDSAALDLARRQERFLELHDRDTAGVMGMLPLVLDMPVRFTNSENREQGVFKHSRGHLRGWCLTEDERERMRDIQGPEIVLKDRPLKLFVEVETATKEMPDTHGKGVFVLKLQHRPWTVDAAGNVKVLRSGFTIVPDFGGTAHAYCGTSLDACLGDLLPWHRKPSRDDALKAFT